MKVNLRKACCQPIIPCLNCCPQIHRLDIHLLAHLYQCFCIYSAGLVCSTQLVKFVTGFSPWIQKTGPVLELKNSRISRKETQNNTKAPCKFADFCLIHWRSTQKDYARLLRKALLTKKAFCQTMQQILLSIARVWPIKNSSEFIPQEIDQTLLQINTRGNAKQTSI